MLTEETAAQREVTCVMISSSGNIGELLNAVADSSFTDVIKRVTAEKRAAEALAKRSSEPLRSRMFEYTQSCRCLMFWLTSKNRPRSCTAFPLFKPLTSTLVAKGSLPERMLAVFE